jgi:hypothetical protein
MCPACMATAALMVAGAISTGGLTAFATKLRHSKTNVAKKSRQLLTRAANQPEEPKREEQ